MNFIQLIQFVGVDAAVNMRFLAGRKDEIVLSHEQWQEVANSTPVDSNLHQFATQKMELLKPSSEAETGTSTENETRPPTGIDLSFHVLIRAYEAAPSESDEKSRLFRQIEAYTGALAEQWAHICIGFGGQELESVALLKLDTMQIDGVEWIKLYTEASVWNNGKAVEFASHKTKLEELALRKIQELTQTFDEWMRVINDSAQDSVLYELAFQKLQGLANAFEQWVDIYQIAPSGSDQEELAKQKYIEFAQTFKQWVCVYELSLQGSDDERLALQKMIELEPVEPPQ